MFATGSGLKKGHCEAGAHCARAHAEHGQRHSKQRVFTWSMNSLSSCCVPLKLKMATRAEAAAALPARNSATCRQAGCGSEECGSVHAWGELQMVVRLRLEKGANSPQSPCLVPRLAATPSCTHH